MENSMTDSSTKTAGVLDDLLGRNDTFANEHDVAELAMMPSLRTIIVSCVDPRVDPAIVADIALGEAVVIRNIGGRVTPGVLRTLGLLAAIARAGGGQAGAG